MEEHQPNRPIIALLTDFGSQEHYVGVMKGVIAGIAPTAALVDLSHDVPAQSILAGQWLLRASVHYFPPGTVFLAVVDPGVGTSRRPIAVSTDGHYFVGPDNGLFTPWLQGSAVELRNYRLPSVSSTFHGRDVFAPAAAHLALGVALEAFGPPINDPVRLLPPQPVVSPDGTITGEVIYVDHFGNLITNLEAPAAGHARYRGRVLPVQSTYGEASEGDLLALIGSEGQLEIAIRNGNAARELQAHAGEQVAWHA